jgi:FkbM family methyltransferase
MVESGSLVVRIPEIGGEFEIGATSHILQRVMVETRYEPELVEVIRRRIDPGKDAIDVGANVGLLTVVMARLLSGSRRVLAIEPIPEILDRLRGNVLRNGCANRVRVFEGVATRSTGECLINYVPGKEEYSSLNRIVHPAVAGAERRQISVSGDTIDNLVARFGLEPGLIKIDTEGAEEQVLAGATTTMRTHRPVIICESWPGFAAAGASAGAVKTLLTEHWYELMGSDCPPLTIVAIPDCAAVTIR